ncbi:MAG TPA: zinc ribbon domain-containing protein [Chthonomonadales bacterium]|nr:zinc ribbon domain-containing protein [Chthonomonadales bacterium]
METRYYQAQGVNIERLATELDRAYAGQGFQTQHFGNADAMTVQMKKGGDVAALVGLQAALTVVMQRSPEGLHVQIGQQRWVEKAAVGAVGFFIPVLWPLMFTAGVGVVMQASLGSQVVNTLDALVHQQSPTAQRGPAPSFMGPFQRSTPAYAPAPLVCQNCQAVNAPDDKFCMQCGKPLTSPEAEKVHCANCGAEMKANAAFCTKCGTAAEAA